VTIAHNVPDMLAAVCAAFLFNARTPFQGGWLHYAFIGQTSYPPQLRCV